MTDSNYHQILLWALLLFLGYFGYGEVLLRLLSPTGFKEFGWATKAALGMSFSIVLASLLMVFKVATAEVLSAIAIFGFCLSLWILYSYSSISRPPPAKKRKSKTAITIAVHYDWLWLIIPGGFALLALLTSVFWPFQFDPNDDWVAYLTFPQMILQTGTLLEPFSDRRILGLGGQSILLAQIMVVAPPECAHLLDRGFGAVLLFGLLVEATRQTQPGWQWLRALMILSAVTASVPRINTGSSQLGIAFMLAFFMTVSKLQEKSHWTWLQSVVPALVLAGASSLRPTFAMFAGGILILFILWRTISSPLKDCFSRLMPLIQTGVLTFTLLIPLMVVSWESSRTPMFLLSRGNLSHQIDSLVSGQGFWVDASIALSFMFSSEVLVFAMGFFLVVLLKAEARRLGISIGLVAIGLIFLISVKNTGTTNSWNMDLYRYTFPLYASAFYWIISKSIENKIDNKNFNSSVLSAFSILVFWSSQLAPAIREVRIQWDVLPRQSQGFKFQTSVLQPFYKDLQKRVPSGEKIFAIVDAPYLLDYGRNQISNVDCIGNASPAPEMPFLNGQNALKEYLKTLGFRYILAVDFNKAIFLYNRKVMENHPRSEFREFSKKYIVDFFNNIDSIAAQSTIAANENCRLIKLE